MDTKLRLTDPTFELERTYIAEALMKPLVIIDSCDKRKDLPTGFV